MVGRLPNAAVAIGAAALGGGLYYTVAIFGSGQPQSSSAMAFSLT
jgi:hypothetical protein